MECSCGNILSGICGEVYVCALVKIFADRFFLVGRESIQSIYCWEESVFNSFTVVFEKNRYLLCFLTDKLLV